MSTLRALSWNVFTGHDPAEVRRTLTALCAEHRPHVIVVTEAAHQDLARFPGYRLMQETPLPAGPDHLVHEEGDTALLIRADVAVRHHRVEAMTKAWIGPKNGWPHTPRRYRSAWLRTPDGQTWKLQGAHWPTGGPGGKNVDAVTETTDHAARWLRRTMPGRPALIVGDLNLTHIQLVRTVIAARAREVGVGPDHALYRNCSADMLQLDKFGSDHHAYLFTFATT